MQDLRECGDHVTSRLGDLGFFSQRIMEERHSIQLFFIRIAPHLSALSLLPGSRARDVESHLDELVPPGGSLLALPGDRTILAAGLATVPEGKLNGDLVATGEVRVGDLRVGDFESGSVLDVER